MAEEWGVGDGPGVVDEEIRAEDLTVPADLCSNVNLKAAEFNEVCRPLPHSSLSWSMRPHHVYLCICAPSTTFWDHARFGHAEIIPDPAAVRVSVNDCTGFWEIARHARQDHQCRSAFTQLQARLLRVLCGHPRRARPRFRMTCHVAWACVQMEEVVLG